MTSLEVVEAIATALSLLALGFGAGAAVDRRRRQRHSLEAALDAVRRALANVEVTALRVRPDTVLLGGQVTIEFEVQSRLSTPLQVWLGADIHFAPDQWFYDVAQDKVLAIDPGRNTYSRYLTVGPPLPPGRWEINAGIWFGPRSDPYRSIRLILKTVPISVSRG